MRLSDVSRETFQPNHKNHFSQLKESRGNHYEKERRKHKRTNTTENRTC